MGDLAQAIVELGRTSEHRRNARRQFREATAVVLTEMLRHLRVGDEARFTEKDDDFLGPYLYRVERIGWPVQNMSPNDPDQFYDPDLDTFPHPKGATTLIRYDGIVIFGDTRKPLKGAVLLDPRTPFVGNDGVPHPPSGRAIWRTPSADEESPRTADLHLATDSDLLIFADTAQDIVTRMSRDFARTADRFSKATDAIARLTAL